MHHLKGRKQSPEHVAKRATSLRRWYANLTANERRKLGKKISERNLIAMNRPDVREKLRRAALIQFANESPEAKALRYAKASISNSKPHNFSAKTRAILSACMSEKAKKAKITAHKWGGGGWNTGLKTPSNTIDRQRKSILQAIADGRFRPQDNLKSPWGVRSWFNSRFGRLYCHSKWEVARITFLASLPDVISVRREPCSIPYIWKRRQHIYIPDFKVRYANGREIIEEIKRVRLEDKKLNTAKFTAARHFCLSHGYEFRVLTSLEEIIGVR